MSNVKAALTRKLGPLPVWVWTILTGVGLYFYRNRGTGSGTVTDNSAATDTTDTTGDTSPVTLEPGETAYNPATGQTITAPGSPDEGGTVGGAGTTAAPIPLSPGASYFDPNSGFFTAPDIADAIPETGPGPRKSATKRKPKKKAAHKPTKHKGHKKPRGKGAIRNAVGRARKKVSSRVKPVRNRTATPHPRGRTRAKPPAARKPVIRQRPAAKHPTPSHNSANHPRATRPAHPRSAPTPHPAAHPRPVTRPPIRKRRK